MFRDEKNVDILLKVQKFTTSHYNSSKTRHEMNNKNYSTFQLEIFFFSNNSKTGNVLKIKVKFLINFVNIRIQTQV
jgi:hypothetical protein